MIKAIYIVCTLLFFYPAFVFAGCHDTCDELQEKCSSSCDMEPCTNPLNDEAACKNICKESCVAMNPTCKTKCDVDNE